MTPYVKNVLDQAHEIPLDSQFTGDLFDGITFEKHLRIDWVQFYGVTDESSGFVMI